MKRLICAFLSIILIFSCLVITPSAACVSSGAGTDLFAGNNYDDQNYDTYGKKIFSHMSVQSDGKIMTVSVPISTNNVLDVNYYNTSYKLTKNVSITTELPIYGGFYDTGKHFYVVSGQKNPGEKNTVEVMRVTKYDKSWKKISHASIFGANTTIPFSSGSLRFAYDGNILYVRTCHQMYASKNDGLNHQANFTFSVNTSTMKIVDMLEVGKESELVGDKIYVSFASFTSESSFDGDIKHKTVNRREH